MGMIGAMRRRLFFAMLSAMSLALWVASVVLWGRSYVWVDGVWSIREDWQLSAGSYRGQARLWFHCDYYDAPWIFDWASDRIVRVPPRQKDAGAQAEWEAPAWRDQMIHAGASADPEIDWQWQGFRLISNDWWHGLSESDNFNYPRPSRAVYFPTWVVVVVTGILPAVALCRIVCWHRRTRAGRCRRCGYDLRATPDRCPECGLVPKASQTETVTQSKKSGI